MLQVGRNEFWILYIIYQVVDRKNSWLNDFEIIGKMWYFFFFVRTKNVKVLQQNNLTKTLSLTTIGL